MSFFGISEWKIEKNKVKIDTSEYENRAIAFIDILGFKSIIDETVGGSKESTEKRSVLFGIMEYIANLEVDIFKDTDFENETNDERCIFSDSVVISYDDKKDVGNAFNLLLEVSAIQFELMLMGYATRGGITFGGLYHKNNVVFGPAMNYAYFLESEKAVFPRIIVSSEFLEYAKENESPQNSKKEEIKFIYSLLKKDSDGYYFVDYLSEYGFADSYEENVYCLKIIKEFILQGLKKTDDRVKAKYIWLKNYYNSIVKEQDEIIDLK